MLIVDVRLTEYDEYRAVGKGDACLLVVWRRMTSGCMHMCTE